MKTKKKWIALTIVALMLFQSCKVYHKKTTTLDEVVLAQKSVKLKTNSNETYIFDRLQKKENVIYAYAKKSLEQLQN